MTLKNATTESTNGCHSTAGEHALAARRLWCDVVLLAIADARNDERIAERSKQRERDMNRRAARAWPRTKDFKIACELAGVDHQAVKKAIEKGAGK